MVYSLILISLIDSKPSPTSAHAATWAVAIIMETILLAASFVLYTTEHREPKVGDPSGGRLIREMTGWEIAEVTLGTVRLLLLLSSLAFYILFMALQHFARHAVSRPGTPEEHRALLQEDQEENGATESTATYGTTAAVNGKPPKKQATPAGWEKPNFTPSRSWWEYIRGYSIFFPYLWPAKDRRLQIIVVICFLIMAIQRVINFLVPYQTGKITDELNSQKGIPWASICLFIVYRLLQGNNGILGAIRSTIWVPVSQYSFRELSVASFEHVHSLSLDFHLGKKTGEVLSALGKGNAINNFLESVTFQVIPMLVDLCVAIGYFLVQFDAYYALVVSIVAFWYVYLTIRMAQWRADLRREYVNSDREVDAVK